MEFEWDDRKEKKNLQKHQVSFLEAAETFFDSKGIQLDDTKHSEVEVRHFWIGKTQSGRVLTTWFTRRDTKKEEIIRIIGSAEWRKFRRYYNETTKAQ